MIRASSPASVSPNADELLSVLVPTIAVATLTAI